MDFFRLRICKLFLRVDSMSMCMMENWINLRITSPFPSRSYEDKRWYKLCTLSRLSAITEEKKSTSTSSRFFMLNFVYHVTVCRLCDATFHFHAQRNASKRGKWCENQFAVCSSHTKTKVNSIWAHTRWQENFNFHVFGFSSRFGRARGWRWKHDKN